MSTALHQTQLISRPRLWSMRLLALAVVTLFCLGLLEGMLRVAGIKGAPLPYDNNLPDATLGMRPEPSKYWKANFPEYPGELYMRTNNLAFYEPADTPGAPPPGVLRVGVVGDSHTVGTCKPEENYPNQLEALLNQAAGARRFDVLNAGVGRYSPYQYYLRAERELLPIATKYLVVAVYAGNDFLDLIREDDRPHLVRAANGRFEPRPPTFMSYPDPSQRPGWIENSRVYQVGRGFLGPTVLYQISRVRLLYRNLSQRGYSLLEIASYLNQARKFDKTAHGLMVQDLHQRLWFKRFPETLESAIATNKRVAELFAGLAKTKQIQITYTVIPTKPQIEPEKVAKVFQTIAGLEPQFTVQDVKSFDETLVNRALADARAAGLDTLDLRPALLAAGERAELYYPADMHLNVAGNAVIARELANHLSSHTNKTR